MKTITLARKPIVGTVVNNVLEHGSGGLNLDGTRISGDVPEVTGQGFRTGKYGGQIGWGEPTLTGELSNPSRKGRFPANLILQHLDGCQKDGVKRVKGSFLNHDCTDGDLFGKYASVRKRGHTDKDGKETVANWICDDGCPVKEIDEQSGILVSGTGAVKRQTSSNSEGNSGASYGAESRPEGTPMISYGDRGGASRFFKQVKK